MVVQSMLEVARFFLQTGRAEVEEGLQRGDQVRVRDGAEKAWNAVVQATEHLMRSRGRTPVPGPYGHRDRRDFLEEVGRSDLAQKYTYFAERLHGDVFYTGAILPGASLRRYLDEVEDYLRLVATA